MPEYAANGRIASAAGVSTRRFAPVLVAVLCLGGIAAVRAEDSLYARLGGEPVVAALVWLAGDRLAIRDPRILLIFLGAMVGAWLLIFFVMVLLGSLSFFLESAVGVFEVWLALFAVMSGYLVPLELLPAWVGRIARLSPFDSMLAFPLETLIGLRSLGTALRDLLTQWAYVAVLAAAGLSVWRRGVRRYVAFGG